MSGKTMWSFITNPQLFNQLILGLYALSVVRHTVARNWWDVVYAVGAVLIMASIAFRR